MLSKENLSLPPLFGLSAAAPTGSARLPRRPFKIFLFVFDWSHHTTGLIPTKYFVSEFDYVSSLAGTSSHWPTPGWSAAPGFTDKMGSFIKQQDIAHLLMWFTRNSHLREVRLWDYFTLHLNINFHPLESPKNSENGAKPWGENRSEYLSNMGPIWGILKLSGVLNQKTSIIWSKTLYHK